MEEIKKNHSKSDSNNVIILILVLILFVLIIGLTYAVFLFGKQGDKQNTVSTGALTFTYTETTNGIYLTDAMPMSDSTGKKLDRQGDNAGYFDFNVSCNVAGTSAINYELYATPIGVDNPLSWDYVKIYLTDASTDQALIGYSEEVPVFKNLSESVSDINSKRLYSGTFTKSDSKKFRLRLWLASNYNVSSDVKMFKMRVSVAANDNKGV